MTRGKWLLLIYLAALVLSLIVRGFVSEPDIPEGGGWEKELIPGTETSLAWRELGNPAGRKLLLIHGSPGASECFSPLIPHLQDDFYLIIPDLPGFGYSRAQGLPDLSILAHARHLSEFLELHDLRGIEVVGYSRGGGVALHLEQMQPDRIDSLVMLSSIGVQEHEMLGDYLLNHVIHGLQLTVFTLVRELVPHFGLLDRVMLNRNYARNFYETDQRPLREMIKNWQKPLQIIHGETDRLVPADAAREHHRLVPQSRLDWVENGSHIDLMRRPDEVAALIKKGPQRDEPVSADKVTLAATPMPPSRIDKTAAGKIAVMTGLGLATFASEDLSCISGGLLVSRNVVNFSTAALGCFLGIFLSDVMLYAIGKWFSSRLSRFAFFRREFDSLRVTAGKAWLEKNAGKMIMVSRFIPGSRVPTYVAMGASELTFRKFALWLLIAGSIWTPILVGISSVFGEQMLPFLERHEKLIFPGFLFLLVLGALSIRFLSGVATWKGRRMLLSRWKRITRWEFWPAWAIYLFVVPTMIRKAIQYKSFTVFTAANPGLPCGGFAYEPKLISLNALKDSGNVPAFREVVSPADVDRFLAEEHISYPIVLKPDAGERGRGVAIVSSISEVEKYMDEVPDDVVIIAQDFVEGSEFGVFYYRFPNENKGRIYAVTEKRMVDVTGDGKHTMEELILRNDRAVCMAEFFLKQLKSKRWDTPEKGQKISLSKLGTHSRGALFLDGSHLNTPELAEEMDRITKHFEGFHFGRYDLKAPSSRDLEEGKGIRVLELNGVTSEATNMYDPIHSFWQGIGILKRQWELVFDIGAANRELGVQPAGIFDLVKNYQSHRRLDKFESP
ncbi:MAG: alpha/beta fold hydrolase [Verrucomicrobiales bacterium]|nr:alpha/beta fold hydrolase [Verrucomicrobiales bacterium]